MHPPGWYQDPHSPHHVRWWDGRAFTGHVQPVPVAQTVPAYPDGGFAHPAGPHVPLVTRRPSFLARQRDAGLDLANGTNAHATVALVTGLVSLLGWPFGCIAGLVFGALGLRRAAQYAAAGHPPLGRGRSAWGFALALVGTVVTVLSILHQVGYLR